MKQMELIKFYLFETCTEKPKSLNTHVPQINAAVEIIHVSSKYDKIPFAIHLTDDYMLEKTLCQTYLE